MESIPAITSFGPATEKINIQKLQANDNPITGYKMSEEKSFSQWDQRFHKLLKKPTAKEITCIKPCKCKLQLKDCGQQGNKAIRDVIILDPSIPKCQSREEIQVNFPLSMQYKIV